jgi:general stress protein YciG
MDKDAQRAIASKGGRAAHARGTAHEFTSEEAAEAGRKGGRAVSRDRRHMAEIGRRGGKAAHSREGPPAPEQAAEHRTAPAEHLFGLPGEQPMGNGHSTPGGQQSMGNGHSTPSSQPATSGQPMVATEPECVSPAAEPVTRA